MNKEIMLSMYFHKDDSNCYSSEDFHFKILVDDFDTIRTIVNSYAKEFKKAYHKWYAQYDSFFYVGYSYKYCDIEKTKSWADTIGMLLYKTVKNYDRMLGYSKLLYKENNRLEEESYYKERKEKGYVSHVHFPVPLSILKGHLPKQVVMDNLDYMESGCVFGYLGASSRMYKHDDWITEIYNSGDEEYKKDISQFVNHSAGRHFMDQIDETTTKEEFYKYFVEYMKWSLEVV